MRTGKEWETVKDGSVKAPEGLINYWSQDTVGNELKVGVETEDAWNQSYGEVVATINDKV